MSTHSDKKRKEGPKVPLELRKTIAENIRSFFTPDTPDAAIARALAERSSGAVDSKMAARVLRPETYDIGGKHLGTICAVAKALGIEAWELLKPGGPVRRLVAVTGEEQRVNETQGSVKVPLRKHHKVKIKR